MKCLYKIVVRKWEPLPQEEIERAVMAVKEKQERLNEHAAELDRREAKLT